MERDELKALFEELEIPTYAYSFNFDKDEAYNIVLERDGNWLVFYSERGNKNVPMKYHSEDEACEDLLRRLQKQFPQKFKNY